MVLFVKFLDFPKKVRKTFFVVSVTLMYAFFCLDPDTLFNDKTYDFKLFNNDFSEVGYMAWFLSTMYLHTFLFITFRCATVLIQDRLIKSIFYALLMDSVFSILNTIFWGYYNPVESIIARNVFVIIALLYAYFILHESRGTRLKG
jgi:hypothetical protein